MTPASHNPSDHKPSNHNAAWTREELTLALYLYCQIPFAKTKANNPEVMRLARLLDRTPASVARKLGNFGAFDPLLTAKGISGLTHSSKADRMIWNEFDHAWDRLVSESLLLLESRQAQIVPESEEDAPIIARPAGATQRQATVLARVGQSFFRRTVLSSYENRCCVCALDLPQLLVGSHIIPWAVKEEQRTDPQNGLCLCVLHDKAFDKGLIAVGSNLEIMVAARIGASRSVFANAAIQSFAGKTIRMPRRFAPHADCLAWHTANVFQKA